MTIFSPRHWAERLSRGKAFWRRLPSDFGHAPIRVSPDAALSLLKPGRRAFDPMLLRLCSEYVEEGSVVWDVGANVGILSLAAAQRGGDVLAIEPDPWLYSLLRATQQHRANRQMSLEPLCAAISAEPGIASLAIAQRGRASSFLEKFDGRSQTGGVRSSCLVPVLTLDLLLRGRPKPTLVKIDVEGAETAVLEGATGVLTEARPTILIEVGNATRNDVIARLKDANYRVFDYETGREINDDDGCFANILARPN